MLENKTALIEALRPLTSRLRTDVTAKKIKPVVGKGGSKVGGGSVWTKEPLTDALMTRHLNGGPARGCAFVYPGTDVTLVCTLDFDSHKGEVPWPNMASVSGRVLSALERSGLRGRAFSSSGGAGVHLICMWEHPQDAHSVRERVKSILLSEGLREGAGGVIAGEVEIFPKQSAVPFDGHGNQCILPLAGASVPLEPLLGMERMERDYIVSTPWEMSDPVPVVQREERHGGRGRGGEGAERVWIDDLASALDAIPDGSAELEDYDDWLEVLCGIHHDSLGSDEGLALALKFSSRSPKFDEGATRAKWATLKVNRSGGSITGRSVLARAREHGWSADEPFDPVGDVAVDGVAVDGVAVDAGEVKGFVRDKKGQIEPITNNVLAALRNARYCGMRMGHDEFRDMLMKAEVAGTEGGQGVDQWVPFVDTDYTKLCSRLERSGFKSLPIDLVKRSVRLVAHEFTFDSAQMWLARQHWDGVPRVETFLIDYMSVPDTPYARAMGRYIWTALAGRVIEPGVKADMMPVFAGEQGCMKTTAVKAMSPDPMFFAEFNFADKDADISRKMRGVLVGEAAELQGLKNRELESTKAFLTVTHERWTPKYQEFETVYPRRLVFFGTTNEQQILADHTGNRRILPIKVGYSDVEGIKKHCFQLWAEGAELFKTDGVAHLEAEKLAIPEHEAFVIEDAWQDDVVHWLNTPDTDTGIVPAACNFLRTSDALKNAVNLKIENCHSGHLRRMAAIFTTLGYVRTKVRDGNKTFWAFVPD